MRRSELVRRWSNGGLERLAVSRWTRTVNTKAEFKRLRTLLVAAHSRTDQQRAEKAEGTTTLYYRPTRLHSHNAIVSTSVSPHRLPRSHFSRTIDTIHTRAP